MSGANRIQDDPRGGNFHIYWYGTCHFWGAFFEQEINFGVSFSASP